MPISSTASNSEDGEPAHTFNTNDVTAQLTSVTAQLTSVQPYSFIIQTVLKSLMRTVQFWIWQEYKGVIELFSMRMWVFIVNCVLVLLKLIIVFSLLYLCFRFWSVFLCVFFIVLLLHPFVRFGLLALSLEQHPANLSGHAKVSNQYEIMLLDL